MKKGTFRRCIIVLFALIILTPTMLSGLAFVRKEMKFDVSVNGYFDPVSKPEFSAESLASGDFQTQFSDWFAKEFKPRNVLTKTYNTIQYYLFHEGNQEIGGHGNVFQPDYCKAEYCTEDRFDYSVPETAQKVDDLVSQMVEVRDRLNACGKEFLVYLTPSKAHLAPQDIPYKYKVQRRKEGVRGADYLLKLLEGAGIPYLNADSYFDVVPYPVFYTTGLHWARPIEQTVDNAVVSKAGQLLGKNYRTIELGEVQESNVPFWRDSDVYDLLNIWEMGGAESRRYYEYTAGRMQPDQFDQIRFFIQGGSFSGGLYNDFLKLYPDSDINKAFYSQYYVIDGRQTSIDGDWSQLPWQEVLDRADCIVVEINEAAVSGLTSGFIAALAAYLDNYEVRTVSMSAIDRIVAGEANEIPEGTTSGLYPDCWTTDYFTTRLRGDAIRNRGLDIGFTVKNEVIQGETTSDDVRIYVNGRKVFENSFTEAWQGTVSISPEQLAENDVDDTYSIVIESNASFIPFRFNINHDERELFLRLNYLGPHRDEASEGGNG